MDDEVFMLEREPEVRDSQVAITNPEPNPDRDPEKV